VVSLTAFVIANVVVLWFISYVGVLLPTLLYFCLRCYNITYAVVFFLKLLRYLRCGFIAYADVLLPMMLCLPTSLCYGRISSDIASAGVPQAYVTYHNLLWSILSSSVSCSFIMLKIWSELELKHISGIPS